MLQKHVAMRSSTKLIILFCLATRGLGVIQDHRYDRKLDSVSFYLLCIFTLVEDDLRWKTTFGGRRPMLEDNLWWKTPLVEDDLRWKTTFGGRRLSVEDDLQWKTTFGGRRPMVEDDLLWKTTFGGRRSLHAA